MIRRAIVLAVVVLPVCLFADEPSPWIGKNVVTKTEYSVKVGDRVVDDGSEPHVYKVIQTRDDWLWVRWGGNEGWLPINEVVAIDQGIDFFTQEIKSNPGNSVAWNRRGIVWAHKREYDNSIADFNEAIRVNSKYASAYNNRGHSLRFKGDSDRAIADYSQAIRLNPKFVWVYLNRGNEWYEKQALDKAIADYSQAIQLDPNFGRAYNSRGVAWSTLHAYDKAIADFCEAIRLTPKYATAYNERAWLWATCPNEKIRDGKGAVESATRACELTDWKIDMFIDTLAAAYAEAGDFNKAIEYQEKANELYTVSGLKKKGEERLKLYKEKKPYRDTE